MLSRAVERALVEIVERAEQDLLIRIKSGRLKQEPEMTTALTTALEIRAEVVDGVSIEFKTLASSGPGTEERQRGADIECFISIDLPGLDPVRKGILVQSKRSGKDGLHLEDHPTGHWLFDGDLQLDASRAVRAQSVSHRLHDQCTKMLKETSASFVWLYGESQVGVVSAASVASIGDKGISHRLGTKRLSDLFLHMSQCFVGDHSLTPTFAHGVTILDLQIASAPPSFEAFTENNGPIDEAQRRQ